MRFSKQFYLVMAVTVALLLSLAVWACTVGKDNVHVDSFIRFSRPYALGAVAVALVMLTATILVGRQQSRGPQATVARGGTTPMIDALRDDEPTPQS